MKLDFLIQGRGAVPVRAIPFVAGFEPFTRKRYLPPSLIWESAKQAADIWPDNFGIPALRLFLQGEDGAPEPAEFDHLGYLASDDDLLPENDEPVHDAALRLPAGLFAYVDQLQRFVDWMYPAGHSGDGQCRDAIQLKLSMQMDVGLSHAIFEGFEHVVAKRTQGNDRVADGTEISDERCRVLASEIDGEQNISSEDLASNEPAAPVVRSEGKRGVSKAEILAAEWPMPSKAPSLENSLGKIPKWIDEACIKVGRAGKGKSGSHLWNPAMLAVCLATRTPQKRWVCNQLALTNFLRGEFSDYFDEWEEKKKML